MSIVLKEVLKECGFYFEKETGMWSTNTYHDNIVPCDGRFIYFHHESAPTDFKVFDKEGELIGWLKRRIKKFRVTIPYIHEFIVECFREEDAIRIAEEQGGGSIIGSDVNGIKVEEVEE